MDFYDFPYIGNNHSQLTISYVSLFFPGVETTNQFRFLPPKVQRDILDKRCLVDRYATQHIGANP